MNADENKTTEKKYTVKMPAKNINQIYSVSDHFEKATQNLERSKKLREVKEMTFDKK